MTRQSRYGCGQRLFVGAAASDEGAAMPDEPALTGVHLEKSCRGASEAPAESAQFLASLRAPPLGNCSASPKAGGFGVRAWKHYGRRGRTTVCVQSMGQGRRDGLRTAGKAGEWLPKREQWTRLLRCRSSDLLPVSSHNHRGWPTGARIWGCNSPKSTFNNPYTMHLRARARGGPEQLVGG